MTRFGRMLGLFTVFLLLIPTVSGAIAADFGYGDVYWHDEKTGQWVKDVDGSWATLQKKGEGDSSFGKTGGSTSITGAAIVDFEEPATSYLGGFRLLGADEPANSYEYISPDGIFSMKATALSFKDPSKIDMVWDQANLRFFLEHERTVAEWEFIYKVTNNLTVGMDVLLVQDNFGDELDIKGYIIETPPGSTYEFETGKPGPNGFQWRNIRLKPGKSAQITFTLAAGENPAGVQQYACGLYNLNSRGVLKYRYDGQPGQGQESIDGMTFPLKVCGDHPAFCFEVSSGGVEWYLRKPGEYFTKVLDATVSVTEDTNIDEHVAVTFSRFGSLTLLNSDQEIPVWYSLADEVEPGAWIGPEKLNGRTELLYPSEGNNASFSVWQKVDLGTQSPGMYENMGVITFTLVNSRTVLCD